MNKIEHKFQKDGTDVIIDLETAWSVLYSKCTGLNDNGKVKNIYTETFAESDETKVWITDEPVREPISCTLTLFFVGDNRQASYHNFVETISQGLWYYWDTKRKRKIKFFLQEAITVKDDNYKGNIKYMEVDFKLTCVWGESFPCDENGEI